MTLRLLPATQPDNFPSWGWFCRLGVLLMAIALLSTPLDLVIRALTRVPAPVSWLSEVGSVCWLACVGYPGYLAGSWITQWTGFRRSTLWAGFVVGVLGGGGAALLNLAVWWIAPGWWYRLGYHGGMPLAQITPGLIIGMYTAIFGVITLVAAFWPGYHAGVHILLRSLDEPPPDAESSYAGTAT